jgi:hypothetical protein
MAGTWQFSDLDMRKSSPNHVTLTLGHSSQCNQTRSSCPLSDCGEKEVKSLLVKCLKCGGEVAGPAKEWDMHPKDGRGPALHIKHFSCPQCGKKFRLATKLAGA